MAVIGGGVSGLATAYRLGSATLFERTARLGGVVATECRDGYVMEAGPDCFLDKPPMRELCRELGLEDQLIGVRQGLGRSFIARGKRLLTIPEGLYLMAPSAIRPFLRSSVISPAGKLRMLLDLLIPARRNSDDESLGSFVRRRLGREALDRLAQPMIGGIYSADPERLSLQATMPQFLDMERRHGGVIRPLLRRHQQASGARYNLFLTFRAGMQTLVDALAQRLRDVRLNIRVDCLPAGFEAYCLCALVPGALQSSPLNVPCSSMATINLGFRRDQVRHPLNGAGFVVPAIEGRSIVACTFSSQKFAGRAAPDRVLLRAFVGGMLGVRHYAATDEAMLAAALRDLDDLLGLKGQPDAVWINRLPHSMPQYEVGHLERVTQLEQSLPPNMAVAGNAHRGVGIPDCIAGGFAAADRLA